MPLFNKPTTIERNGYANFQALGHDLVSDMLTRGFVAVTPFSGSSPISIILKPVPVVAGSTDFSPDPLSDTQSWVIRIDYRGVTSDTDPGYLRVNVCHPEQVREGAEIVEEASFRDAATNTYIYARESGEITCGWYYYLAVASGGTTSTTTAAPSGGGSTTSNTNRKGPGGVTIKLGSTTIPFASKYWAEPDVTKMDISELGAKTYSYRLTVSYQGIALIVWEEAQDKKGNTFSWLVVQRPVSPVNGAILKTGRCPVFCMYSIGGGNPNIIDDTNRLSDQKDVYARIHDEYDNNPAIYRFTVRESDVNKATTPVLATVDSPDHRAVINGKQQVGITESHKYVISFANGFNTARYIYREDMDLIAYTSADVISQWSEVSVPLYGEIANRTYKAMHANLPNNTGMRILILTYGPGFD